MRNDVKSPSQSILFKHNVQNLFKKKKRTCLGPDSNKSIKKKNTMYDPIKELNTDWILDGNKIFSFFTCDNGIVIVLF